MGAGVSSHRAGWQAYIRLYGKQVYLGTYESQEAAARAYDLRAKEEYKDPILNYLSDGQLNPDRKGRRKNVKKKQNSKR